MSVPTIAALVALGLSLLARRRQRQGALSLDDWALTLSMQLGIAGLLATLLACAGLLGPHSLALCCALVAASIWPWSEPPPFEPPPARGALRPSTGHSAALMLIVALGVLLRSPPIAAPLAGRDQGTYALRAAASLRTGGLDWTDELLARAGAELDGRATPAGTLDLLGLYPISDEPWRAGVYEGAYRPGSYLAERARGRVVPQFFHLHPLLLAVFGAAAGPLGILWCPVWVAGLALLCFACVARRLWPRGPWAPLALALVAGSPLAIWVARTPLSENPMALFEWSAVLAALRLCAGDERPRAASYAIAGSLALCAGVRGNALIMLPLVLAFAWLRRRDEGAPAARLVLAGLVASGWLHALTSFPYVHDEILRRVPALAGGPRPFMASLALGALAWLLVDGLAQRAPAGLERARGFVLRVAPALLVAACFAALALWALLRFTSAPGAPYSRLDAAPALLGLPSLAGAAAGLVVLARRWRPEPAQLWLVALASVVPATLLLYAPRGLPTLSFFYYGRYLVPELLPTSALLCCLALERLHAALAPRRPRLAWALPGSLAAGLLASVSAPLATHPQLRLREYEPADAALEWLSARLPEGAVVIAGGEGWHNGHTHNQVGGALALARGVSVLPYRTREDAWVSAWELLVAGPERRGEPPPPVFLLINEAAHALGEGEAQRRALIDDMLWAPFAVEQAALLELYVHALSPTPSELPTRVARHELRMALLELRVDPDALAAITRIELEPGSCVSPSEVLRLELPRPAGARHMVLVAGDLDPRMARGVPRWRVRLDGELAALEPLPGLRAHPRATLGPLPLPEPERDTIRLELRGADMSAWSSGGACPHARLARVLLLPRERSALAELEPERLLVQRLAPARELGHAIGTTRWVTGRSLSRYRPGIEPTPPLVGLALALEPGAELGFAPVDLPLEPGEGRAALPRTLDVVVTLARSHARAGAGLQIYADEQLIGRVELPAARGSSFVAQPLRWQPTRDRARLKVRLDEDAGGAVELRDLALFSIAPAAIHE